MKNRWAKIIFKFRGTSGAKELGTVSVEKARLIHYFKDTHYAGLRVMVSLCGIIARLKDLDSDLSSGHLGAGDKKCEKCQKQRTQERRN